MCGLVVGADCMMTDYSRGALIFVTAHGIGVTALGAPASMQPPVQQARFAYRPARAGAARGRGRRRRGAGRPARRYCRGLAFAKGGGRFVPQGHRVGVRISLFGPKLAYCKTKQADLNPRTPK